MAKKADRPTFTWARCWRLDTFLSQAYGWSLYDIIDVEAGPSDTKYEPAAKWLTENSEQDPDLVDSFFDVIFEKPKLNEQRKPALEKCSPAEMWAFLGLEGPMPAINLKRTGGSRRKSMQDVLAARKAAQASQQQREETPPSEPPPAHDEPVQQLAPATAEQDKVAALEARLAAQDAQMAQMMAMMQQMMLAQAPASVVSQPDPEPAPEPEQEEAEQEQEEEAEGVDTLGEDATDFDIL